MSNRLLNKLVTNARPHAMIANMLERLKKRLMRERFLTSPLGIVVNPFYIIRNGLYRGVLRVASEFQGEILDFGCGSRPYESLFTNASRYVGVDVEASGHNHRRSKVDVYYDGRRLPFADASFDGVVAFEVLEHVFNLDETLDEMRRVLRPGGKILITAPFAWEEHETPYDFARYTSYGMRAVLERTGFEVVEIKKTTTYVLAVGQMGIAYLAQHVLPKNRALAAVTQLLIVFPMTVMALAANAVLPKRYEYFCNCALVAKKSGVKAPEERASAPLDGQWVKL
jgi:SAM-dependent methyltransferase